jgi:hypothetical protein
MSKKTQYRELVQYLDDNYGGEWFYNTITEVFQEFRTGITMTKQAVDVYYYN